MPFPRIFQEEKINISAHTVLWKSFPTEFFVSVGYLFKQPELSRSSYTVFHRKQFPDYITFCFHLYEMFFKKTSENCFHEFQFEEKHADRCCYHLKQSYFTSFFPGNLFHHSKWSFKNEKIDEKAFFIGCCVYSLLQKLIIMKKLNSWTLITLDNMKE